MIAGGVDAVTVVSYLGHSSASMTLNVYATLDPDAKASALKECFRKEEKDIPQLMRYTRSVRR